jgi:hypothetical protein
MLVGVTIADMAQGDATRWASIAALTALITAGMCVLAWLLRLSSLVNFISQTILLGFKAGAACTVAPTQLPRLFGVKGGGESCFERLVVLGGQIPETGLAVLSFGVVAIVLLLPAEKFPPGKPAALVAVIASIVVLSLSSLGELGFKVVGALPTGLPDFRLPGLRVRDVDGVIPLAFACLLLSYVQSVSAARAGRSAPGRDRPAPGVPRPRRGQPGRGAVPGSSSAQGSIGEVAWNRIRCLTDPRPGAPAGLRPETASACDTRVQPALARRQRPRCQCSPSNGSRRIGAIEMSTAADMSSASVLAPLAAAQDASRQARHCGSSWKKALGSGQNSWDDSALAPLAIARHAARAVHGNRVVVVWSAASARVSLRRDVSWRQVLGAPNAGMPPLRRINAKRISRPKLRNSDSHAGFAHAAMPARTCLHPPHRPASETAGG